MSGRKSLTREQRVMLNEKTIDMKVSAFEGAIIEELRKLKFASMSVYVRDGIPGRYEIIISKELFSETDITQTIDESNS